MSFDQSTIIEVYPPKSEGAGDRISWDSSSPSGTLFQIYIDNVRVWSGDQRSAVLHVPDGASIAIGAVGPDDRLTDYSADLDPIPETRAKIEWTGGLFEGLDLSGFRVYGEATPGGGIDYTTPLADMQAFASGTSSDGFGNGGYGEGGFGAAGGSFSWTSSPLTSGTWHFAVVPYDASGNEGTAATGSQSIVAPPGPPKRNDSGKRLTYTYDDSTFEITLNWLESESA